MAYCVHKKCVCKKGAFYFNVLHNNNIIVMVLNIVRMNSSIGTTCWVYVTCVSVCVCV